MKFTCIHCGKTFSRCLASDEVARHCSYPCKSAATRKIDSASLKRVAMTGMSIVKMSEALSVDRRTVRIWLERDGLLDSWRTLRRAA